jgi:hypothetical protein
MILPEGRREVTKKVSLCIFLLLDALPKGWIDPLGFFLSYPFNTTKNHPPSLKVNGWLVKEDIM